MFIGWSQPQDQLRSEERNSTREIHQSRTIPLLRTERERFWPEIYKHVTPNGVKLGNEMGTKCDPLFHSVMSCSPS